MGTLIRNHSWWCPRDEAVQRIKLVLLKSKLVFLSFHFSPGLSVAFVFSFKCYVLICFKLNIFYPGKYFFWLVLFWSHTCHFSGLCPQGTLLVMFRGPYVMMGVELEMTMSESFNPFQPYSVSIWK